MPSELKLKKLQKSIVPHSIIVSNEDNIPEYIEPGNPGQVVAVQSDGSLGFNNPSGGGGALPYILLVNSATISIGNYYNVNCTSGDIILTLSNGVTVGDMITVRRDDDSKNQIFVNSTAGINGYNQIEISMQEESYDLYRNGTEFYIK